MNIVNRYTNYSFIGKDISVYRLAKAEIFIPILLNHNYIKKKDPYINKGVFKNKRVRQALGISKKDWRRITGGKTAWKKQKEAWIIVAKIKRHLILLKRSEPK